MSSAICLDPNNRFIQMRSLIDFKRVETIIEANRERDFRGRNSNIEHHARIFVLMSLFPNWTYNELMNNLKENVYVRNFANINNNDSILDVSVYKKFAMSVNEKATIELLAYSLEIAMDKKLILNENINLDSTIKEANITYPTDLRNLLKLIKYLVTVMNYYKKNNPIAYQLWQGTIEIDELFKDTKGCFFEKNIDKKKELFLDIYNRVRLLLNNFFRFYNEILIDVKIRRNHIQKIISKLFKYGEKYLLQVKYYIENGKACKGKILSFHQDNAVFIDKKKEGKHAQVGRVWQVITFSNNFAYGVINENLFFPDATCLNHVLESLFINVGFIPNKIRTDRGDDSEENIKTCKEFRIRDVEIQSKNITSDRKVSITSSNKRSGVEGSISQVKKKGLGKSRMQTDKQTVVEGFKSFFSHNFSKLISLIFN